MPKEIKVGGEYIANKIYTGYDYNIGASYSPYQIYPMPEGHFEMSYSFLLNENDILLQYYLENGLYEEAVKLMEEKQGD